MQINSITQLSSVDSLEKIQALNTLGIYTLRDMAEYAVCRHAEFVLACFKQGSVEDAGLENYIEAEALTEENLSRLDELGIVYLISVSESDAAQLTSAFGVETLGQLAALPPYQEAQHIVLENIRGEFYEKPSAPQALIPRLIGSTHTQARFSNYVKEKEYRLDDYELTYFSDQDEPEPAAELIDIFYRSEFKFYLGYLAAIHQKWINAGTHLGEIIHSLALAPGESRNIAVLDWYRRQRSSRREDTTAAEALRAEFLQTRALNEVVQTTANEHLYGSTEVDATTKTTGAGLVGGKASGAATGGSVSTDLLALIGLPLKAASSAVASTANSIGGSLVYSNGSVQGTLKSETTGERTVTGEVVQNISDATVQNASNVRSVMSTVVVEDEQSGRQRAQTRNVTNYNHSHALTIQYYEVLHSYRIDTTVDSLSPVLFLPFGPITFQIELIKDYWYIFGRAIRRVLPGRFIEYDQVVKDFNPQNEAFDASGDLRITQVKITRTRSYSEPIRVKFFDANPEVTLAISGFDMDDCLRFKMTGSSTYIDYDILDIDVNTLSDFGSVGLQNSATVDSFEIDEGISASLNSDFMKELKENLKSYLGNESKTPNAPFGTLSKNLEDNELGVNSNRDNLKDDVDNDLFSIINTGESVDLTINLEYTVEDKDGQTQTVFQTIHKTYTYGQLKGEINEDIADVTAQINSQLATISDINPADLIDEIEQHFNFHKYGYTKYLLANVEKEQIIDIIDHLGIYGTTETLALSALIDPNPIGLTENLLVFRLREDGEELHQRLGKNFFSAVQAPLFGSDVTLSGHGLQQSTVRKGRSVRKYTLWGQPIPGKQGSNYSTANLTLYIDDRSQKGRARAVEGSIDLITNLGGRQFTNPVALQGTVNQLDDKSIQINYTASGAIPHGLEGTIDWNFDYPQPNGENVAGLAMDYVHSLQEYEAAIRKRHRWDTVFLPSSGVFAEAILGLSNASEYLNLRRFFNWQDSPIPNLAPAVQAVNLNQDYAQPIPGSLTPTVPVSVLNQIAPQQYPMPTSLTSALEAIQNGSMFTDMSKTSQLTTILGSLAELANNTAQLSGNLAGDAAANALNAAVALGQQVASMVGTAMNTNVADPPKSLTSQGGVIEYLDEVKHNSNGGPIAPTDQAGTGAVGAPIPSPSNGGSSGGNGTPSPSPSPSPTPQPEDTTESPYNTADSVSGTLTVLTAPPEPYKYVVMNVLAMLDEFIPQEVDDELASVYTTLKEFVISLGDDEAKKGAAIGLLKKLKPGLKAPGALMGIGLAVDLLTSETFIELAEGVLILLYDFIYYFCFPYLEFAGVNDVGVWFDCEIDYTKPKGAAAQVSTKTTNPFNFLYYRLGGSPNPNPPKDGWGIESLSGSWRIPLIDTDYQKIFTVEAVDQASGNDLTLRIDAELVVMVNLVQIIQALRENLMADLYETLNGLEAYAEEQLKQLVLAMINSLDEGLLESMLQSLGFTAESIATIQAIIASGFELLGWVGGKLIDVNFLIANLALYCFDTITGFFYNLAYSPEFKYYLDLDLNLKYQSAYPERWTIQPEGHTTKFPQLTVTSNGQSGKVVEVYKKNDIDPTGLLSLLFPLDEIVTGKPKDL